jgi:tetratricopeptide (TPR) repeat protein
MPDSLREQLQAALGDAFQIERELPAGGMSRLFIATERSLARQVVVKVLPPEFASEVSAARFQREMSVAAHLQHPHVLPILSAGSRGGLLFYVMPYVPGESLRDRLRREGRLGMADAVRILSEIADALAYAHARGIVHRDVKPENILLEADHAVLADFGIARALASDDGRPAGERLTGTGMSIGTPGYMAPEQLVGETGVDARTDVYALAIVGYEMLVGEAPFSHHPARAALAAHLTERPPPVRTLRPETPGAVADAIDRALCKDPAGRPATGALFRQALGAVDQPASPVRRRRTTAVVAGVVIVAAMLAAGLWAWHAGRRPVDRLSASTVAVLPFAPSGPAGIAYLGAGMVDLLSTTLDGAGDLHSVDPRAVLAAVTPAAPGMIDVDGARRIARQLGAGLFVLGTVVDVGGKLRLGATLYDGMSSRALARATADGDTSDVFGLVDRVGAQLMAGRARGPSARITQLASVTTPSLPALKAYLEGETAIRANQFDLAVDALHRAISADTAFGLAYYRLSIAEEWQTHASEAIRAAEQAVRHSDRLSSHDRELLAAVDAERRGDMRSESMLRSILATYPDDYEAWWQLGEILFHFAPVAGRPIADAEPPFRRVLALDPTSEAALVHLARIAAHEGRRAATDSLVSRALASAPAGGRSLELSALRAVIDGDSSAFAVVLRELAHAEDFAAELTGWSLTLFAHRFDAAGAAFAVDTDPARPSEVRARGMAMLAAFEAMHGRLAHADAMVDRIAPVSTAWSLEYRGLLATLPYRPADTVRARMVRARLGAWNAAATPDVTTIGSTAFSGHNGLHAVIQAYLIGLLDVALGDTVAAAHVAQTMPTLPGAATYPAIVERLAAAIADDASLAVGRAPTASEPRITEYYEWFIGSPFRSASRERFRHAQALATAGDDSAAVRWYASFDASAPDDVIYLAPSYLARARLAVRAGHHAEAAAHYRAFLALWHDCDPALRPMVTQAEHELATL